MQAVLGSLISQATDIPGVMKCIGAKPRADLVLKDDDSFQDNVDFIYNQLGADRNIEIQKDMPSIYDHCGIQLAPAGGLVRDLDASMKAAYITAMNEISAVQKANGGFISFKQLKAIFENKPEMYHPVVEDDVHTNKHDYFETGFVIDFEGADDSSRVHKARQCMQDCVQEKGGSEVWDTLQINTEGLAKLFGARGVAVKDLGSLVADKYSVARVAIDIGICRFPRIDDAFFKVHRFRVIVYNSRERIIAAHKESCGIFCEFRSRKYKMTEAFSAKFGSAVAEKVDKAFADAMSGLGIEIQIGGP